MLLASDVGFLTNICECYYLVSYWGGGHMSRILAYIGIRIGVI